jgi:hypothetical protein
MLETDAIRKGQLLEDEFFHLLDQELRAQLRESVKREELKKQLAAATGFRSQQLLDHLVDSGFEAATVSALALVPTVFVAWADRWVSPGERQAVMSAASQRGLEHEPTAFQLIEAWLRKRPPEPLWKLWKEYAQAVHDTMSPSLADQSMKEILRQATIVAEASGGAFGFGKVSKQEQAVLDEIEHLFT